MSVIVLQSAKSKLVLNHRLVCRIRELSAFSSGLAERATGLYTDVVRSTLFINKGYVSLAHLHISAAQLLYVRGC